MKANRNVLTIILVIVANIALVGCQENEASSSGDSFIRTQSVGTKCYRGINNQFNTCIALNTVDEVNTISRDYNYPNPDVTTLPNGFNPEAYRPPIRLVDTIGAPNLRLVEFFTLNELLPSKKGRWGIISSVALDFFNAVRRTANAPIIINSAYRSPARNSTIDGAATWSRHMYGDAFDFYSPQKTLRQLRALCLQQGASFIQLYSTHIHCDWRHSQRDSDFFGPDQILPPTISVNKALQDLAQLEWWIEENQLFAEVAGVIKEDEAELLYHWQLEDPNGVILESDENILKVPLSAPGMYTLRVEVGGHIEFTRHFEWTPHEH